MGAIPLSYSYRNLWTRKLTTLLTLSGVALVVFVFAAVLMMAYGLQRTLVATGSKDNFVIIRKSANSDVLSTVGREESDLISTFPEVALGTDGKPVISKETVTIINMYKFGSNDMSNVIVRGVSPAAVQLRPQVHLIRGSMFRPGTTDVVVGKSIARRFKGADIGDTINFASQSWKIVGIFEGARSGFESEIWCDVDLMMTAFSRPVYSTMTFKMKEPGQLKSFKTRMESEPRLQELDVKNEQDYFAEQSNATGTFIRVLGLFITIVFSIGAVFGAMITMYAAVANRTAEVGTLRALGFLRRYILLSFLIEAVFLSLVGGLAGILLASFLQTVSISTINFDTFSEIAFNFTLSSAIVAYSLLFSVIMGIFGGFLPAVRASRLNIVNALREQ